MAQDRRKNNGVGKLQPHAGGQGYCRSQSFRIERYDLRGYQHSVQGSVEFLILLLNAFNQERPDAIEEIEEIDGKIEVFSRCEALSARNSLRDEGVLPSSAVALHPSWCVLAAVEGQRAEFALCYAPRASLGSRVVPSGTLPEGCATF